MPDSISILNPAPIGTPVVTRHGTLRVTSAEELPKPLTLGKLEHRAAQIRETLQTVVTRLTAARAKRRELERDQGLALTAIEALIGREDSLLQAAGMRLLPEGRRPESLPYRRQKLKVLLQTIDDDLQAANVARSHLMTRRAELDRALVMVESEIHHLKKREARTAAHDAELRRVRDEALAQREELLAGGSATRDVIGELYAGQHKRPARSTARRKPVASA